VNPLTHMIADKEIDINTFHNELYLLKEEAMSKKKDGQDVIARLNLDIETKSTQIVDLESKIEQLEKKKEKNRNELASKFDGVIKD
jgi:hypothetical protein